MNRDDRPLGAEQRARRQQAEAEQRRLQAEQEQRKAQQAQAYRPELQRDEPEAVRRREAPEREAQRAARPQPGARPVATPPERGLPGRERHGRGGPPPRNGRQADSPRQYRHDQNEDHLYDEDDFIDERPQRVRSRWFTALLMVTATLIGCLILSTFLVQSAFDLFGLNQFYQQIEVTIPENPSISDVVSILGQSGVVSQPLTFRFYLNFRSVDPDAFLPGDYVLNSQMSYDEVIRALMIGHTAREVVRLTFIEGWSIWQIADFLEENRVIDAEVFIEYLRTADFGFEFVNAIEDNPLRIHRLEGYLFPDTYDFYIGESPSSVARKFLRNFNDRVMTPQLLRRMDELDMTVDEVIILASLIQREAGLLDDMRMVSSVFHNRLNSPHFPMIQSDVGIIYLEREIRPRFEAAGIPINQEMFDANNTYVIHGLPVGAAGNPGMDAIMAALHPEDAPFFFFVTDEEGDFYYAVTFERHLHNIALARAVGDGVIHGIDTQGY